MVINKHHVSVARMRAAFHRIYAELESRLNRCARHFHDPQDALVEMLAFSWINFRSKALRTGQFLSAKALAWVAWRRQLSGRRIAGFSVRDAKREIDFEKAVLHIYFADQKDVDLARADDGGFYIEDTLNCMAGQFIWWKVKFGLLDENVKRRALTTS
jgi:hypothetical protein